MSGEGAAGACGDGAAGAWGDGAAEVRGDGAAEGYVTHSSSPRGLRDVPLIGIRRPDFGRRTDEGHRTQVLGRPELRPAPLVAGDPAAGPSAG